MKCINEQGFKKIFFGGFVLAAISVYIYVFSGFGETLDRHWAYGVVSISWVLLFSSGIGWNIQQTFLTQKNVLIRRTYVGVVGFVTLVGNIVLIFLSFASFMIASIGDATYLEAFEKLLA